MSAEVPDAVTVSELLDSYQQQGYVVSFGVEPGGNLRCGACNTPSSAGEMSVDAFARVEGASDPDDMAVVAVVVCPWCQVAGTLVASYGPLASPEDADVVATLNDERPQGQPAVLFPNQAP
ncbi:MAG TPA: hypothetical protein VMZ22_05595 [Acidimicrobiales bacterium]|nr:hypothetical protein [Acidimicrobiales bacterium]